MTALRRVLLVIVLLVGVVLTGGGSTAQEPIRSGWFGDSIPEGCCRSVSTDPKVGQVASSALGWATPVVKAQGGTGYLSAGSIAGRKAYPDRIGTDLAVSSVGVLDVVVIMGGGNDSSADLTAYRAAVRTTFTRARTAQPSALVYVVAPYSPNAAGYVAKNTVTAEEAARAGFPYVDLNRRGWFDGAAAAKRLWSDNFHPNTKGHRYLGEQLARELLWLGAPRGPVGST